MKHSMSMIGFAIVVVLAAFVGCASAIPPSRLETYLGPLVTPEPAVAPALPSGPIKAGLILVTDTTAPDAAPPPPDEALARLKETLQQKISSDLPVIIEKIIPVEELQVGGGIAQLSELGKKHDVAYILLVVASATEKEYPLTIFLGWTAHSQPGLRRDNWSLLEAALIDVKTREVLVHAEGRGWATLDRPTAPGINQWYPVIWLRPQDPNRRYWPPTYAGAPNTLRVIAMNEAARRLVLNLQDAWIEKRQMELRSAQG